MIKRGLLARSNVTVAAADFNPDLVVQGRQAMPRAAETAQKVDADTTSGNHYKCPEFWAMDIETTEIPGMTDKPHDQEENAIFDTNALDGDLETTFDAEQLHVQHLAWALFDEHITDDEKQQLDDLLATDADARSMYIECVQLHVDLHEHFRASGQDPSKAGGPSQSHQPLPPLDLPAVPGTGSTTPSVE